MEKKYILVNQKEAFEIELSGSEMGLTKGDKLTVYIFYDPKRPVKILNREVLE